MTMIEMVEKAIVQCRMNVRRENDTALAKVGFWPDRNKQPSDRQYALAVLTALLEPNELMTEAGTSSLEFDSDGGLLGSTEEAVSRAFAAMIQMAIDENEAG